MPRHCSAGGCKSRDNRETRNAGITFHKLPKGATRRNLWITNSHRADSWDPQTDFVYFCSKHFTPESFELTGCSGIRRLKEDAFPTVFDSSSTTKYKTAGALHKQGNVPARKNPSSDDQEGSQQETNRNQAAEAIVQTSVETPEQANENTPAALQEPSVVDHQKRSSSPPTVSRPLSPTRYMRRLPPPPGFYLSKEHSYAQLCPLLWRRRYDQAIDCLEKALRQLHAARRRENRLRSTVLKLRDKRLKQALSRDGYKNKGSWAPGAGKRQCKGSSNQEESETDTKPDDTGVFEDRCEEQIELGGHFLSDTNSWSEEEKGHCFYCGRGQVALRLSKTGNYVQPPVHEDSLKIKKTVETSTCSTAENAQMGRLESLPGTSLEISDSDITMSHVKHQSQGHAIPAGVLSDIHEQSLPFTSPQQKLLLSDMSDGDTEVMDQEHHLDLQQQQLFWIQDGAKGQIILMPVSDEDRLQSILKMGGVAVEAQTILVSDMGLAEDLGPMTQDRIPTECDGEQSEQSSVINSTSAEMREDVREKLKEHLEGFHLQLSTEFVN